MNPSRTPLKQLVPARERPSHYYKFTALEVRSKVPIEEAGLGGSSLGAMALSQTGGGETSLSPREGALQNLSMIWVRLHRCGEA
jgi:hypothetical protein